MSGPGKIGGAHSADTARGELPLTQASLPTGRGRSVNGGNAEEMAKRWLVAATATAAVVLPLAGAAWAGRDLRRLLRFPPPLEIPTSYPRWSWIAAVGVAGCVAALAAPWVLRLKRAAWRSAPRVDPGRSTGPVGRLPVWGVLALAWTGAWWFLAWTRFPWFAALQRFTFFPLWFGFILSTNALTTRRTGTCLLLRQPGRWVALFAASAFAWWGFEWMNRFVQNWHYLGVADFGAWAYASNATLCFSTVLPAVAAVAEWLISHRTWREVTGAGPCWRVLEHRRFALAVALLSLAALIGAGARPQWCYAALWAAPVGLLLALPVLAGQPGPSRDLARGDWRTTATWMIAALVCGGFWEMWNAPSAAKWIYTVPGVDRWHLFEMPMLGYSGYLAFGLECRAVTEAVLGRRWVPAASP